MDKLLHLVRTPTSYVNVWAASVMSETSDISAYEYEWRPHRTQALLRCPPTTGWLSSTAFPRGAGDARASDMEARGCARRQGNNITRNSMKQKHLRTFIRNCYCSLGKAQGPWAETRAHKHKKARLKGTSWGFRREPSHEDLRRRDRPPAVNTRCLMSLS
jgi:hypothetical protein